MQLLAIMTTMYTIEPLLVPTYVSWSIRASEKVRSTVRMEVFQILLMHPINSNNLTAGRTQFVFILVIAHDSGVATGVLLAAPGHHGNNVHHRATAWANLRVQKYPSVGEGTYRSTHGSLPDSSHAAHWILRPPRIIRAHKCPGS